MIMEIKVPSDEEIKKECEENDWIPSDHLWQGFVDGAKWMREKMQELNSPESKHLKG